MKSLNAFMKSLNLLLYEFIRKYELYSWCISSGPNMYHTVSWKWPPCVGIYNFRDNYGDIARKLINIWC